MAEEILVAGTWKKSGRTRNVVNPSTGEEVFSVHQAEGGDFEEALESAKRAFSRRSLEPTYVRRAVLSQVVRLLGKKKEQFSQIITKETGKPIRFSRQEVDRAILTFTIAQEESSRIEGAIIPLDLVSSSRGREALVRRFPLGPIVAITPFNFPLNLVAHKVGPAIASGCPIILKPSSNAPCTALKLGALLLEAGIPEGYLSILPCSGDECSQLIEDQRVKLVSFTGSPGVGWSLKERVGKKRVVLELGGNAAVIVHRDASLDDAVAKIVLGAFGNAGQSCISVQRVYVHEEVFEKTKTLLLEATRKVIVGDPSDEQTVVGPMITENAARKIEDWIIQARDHGGELLCGGSRNGAVIQPTILWHVPNSELVVCKEVFAPVIVLESFKTEDEVIREINQSAFGLQAGLFTNDAHFIFRAFKELEVGGLIVNDASSYRMDHMPYGGVKDSGFGREGVRYAMEEMTEMKLLALPWN